MAGPFGVEGAIALYHRFDAEFLDALVFAWNERQTDPDERLEDYLLRCVEADYERQGEAARLEDLGYEPGMVVVS